VAKYVNKKSDMDLAAKGLGAKEWNNSLKTKLSLLPKKLFRIRMSRNFGMKMLTMTNLSTECLIQLTKLGYDRSEERFSRNAETDLVCRLLLEKKKLLLYIIRLSRTLSNYTTAILTYTLSLHDALPI